MDALQKVSDDPLRVCPKCNEGALVKKVSAAGFRLKGSGWYETDFKSGGKRNVAGEGGSEKSSATSDGAGASDGKSSSTEKSTSGTGSPSGTGSSSAADSKAS